MKDYCVFTGIAQAQGELTRITQGSGWDVTITTSMPIQDLVQGASLACSGICLTVVEKGEDWFTAHLSQTTLGCTTAGSWKVGSRINLERALRMGDELGGHMVTGHVDGLAQLTSRRLDGGSAVDRFEIASQFLPFLVPKGSVTLDGVSLTVHEVEGTHFTTTLIPHTLHVTTLGTLKPGDSVNVEVDMLARYVSRMTAPVA